MAVDSTGTLNYRLRMVKRPLPAGSGKRPQVIRLWLLIISVFVGVSTGHAQTPYQLDRGREWLLLGSGSAVGICGLIAYDNVKQLTLDEIDALELSDINSFDRGAIKPYHKATASDVIAGASVLLPLTFLANDQIKRDWKVVGIMWGETLLLESGMNTLLRA